MIKKRVEVNLYDQFILYKGSPLEFSCGFRHQSRDIIFIVAPEVLKHELFALGSRDVGFPVEYHCSDPNCFGSAHVKQEKEAKLCDKHSEFFKDKLSRNFDYTLNPIIFSNEERYEMLVELLGHHSELFSQQTEIRVEINKATRRERKEIKNHWLVSIRDDGYKYHKPGFDWRKHYKKELEMNGISEPGNLAINICNLQSIAKYGDLDGYRNRFLMV
ncbi:MAG: hypothetical protein JSV92_01315 [archaeon]|nr:MAG: hypothetical protein JSV92_01315 [archaeon]